MEQESIIAIEESEDLYGVLYPYVKDEDFMALYEKYPEFDDFDDAFVENEEEWTSKVAYYIDENIQQFATIIK